MHNHYNFAIKYKDQSLFMKFIGMLLFFNKAFMTSYITTIGKTIYFPNKDFVLKNDNGACQVLAHELVHIKQAERWSTILFSLMYLFPQCLVVFALFVPISNWFLLFLLCLLPLPAPFRMAFEVGGYTMSLFWINFNLKEIKKLDPSYIHCQLEKTAKNIEKNYFKSSAYWFMWPFSTNLSNKITDIENDVISGTDEIYNCVRQSYLTAIS